MKKDDDANRVIKAKNLLLFVVNLTSNSNISDEHTALSSKMFNIAFSYFEHMLREYKLPASVKDVPFDKKESSIQLFLLNALFDIAHEKNYITNGVFSEFGGFFEDLAEW